VNKDRAAKVVKRTDDNRGDRRDRRETETETKKGRNSDVVADNEPKHTTEAMHRKEEPNLKLTNNKRKGCAQTYKKTTTPLANLQRRVRTTQTRREIFHAKRERE